MKEFKGTPGPWVVDEREYVIDKEGKCVAAFGGIIADHEDEANATICAAAPDLLQALVDIVTSTTAFHSALEVEHDCDGVELIKRAQAAINKALGE